MHTWYIKAYITWIQGTAVKNQPIVLNHVLKIDGFRGWNNFTQISPIPKFISWTITTCTPRVLGFFHSFPTKPHATLRSQSRLFRSPMAEGTCGNPNEREREDEGFRVGTYVIHGGFGRVWKCFLGSGTDVPLNFVFAHAFRAGKKQVVVGEHFCVVMQTFSDG